MRLYLSRINSCLQFVTKQWNPHTTLSIASHDMFFCTPLFNFLRKDLVNINLELCFVQDCFGLHTISLQAKRCNYWPCAIVLSSDCKIAYFVHTTNSFLVNVCCFLVFDVFFCCFMCWFLYGQFCHGALKGKLSDSFTNYNYVGNTKVSVSI